MKKIFSLALILALGIVAEVVNADFTFGDPTNLGPTVNTSAHDLSPRTSGDELTLFFASVRGGGLGGYDLYVMTRPATSEPWDTPVNLGSTVNSAADDYSLSISADSLALYFVSDRAGGSGGYDIWVTVRVTEDAPWEAPVNLGSTVNSSANEYALGISDQGRMLFFTSNRGGGSGGYDVWVTTRPTTGDVWGVPVNLGSTVNSSSNEWALGVSADGLALYIASQRPGGYGSLDIWATRRATTNDGWGPPVNLGPILNTSALDGYPLPSADGRTFYFSSDRPGGSGRVDLWQAPIVPIVDFDDNGIVDFADMSIMVDYWGTDESLCDIDSMPWGDDIVDIRDLLVLTQHWLEDTRLLAHWKLDEIDGAIAHDEAGKYDGEVHGEATWDLSDGVLELDGVDDYIQTPFVLNPSDGPFSVFAWVKTSAAGKAIVSQTGTYGVNWLAIDGAGRLVTELQGSGRGAAPLGPGTVITDNQWHRVGFTWDGTYRILYVDDVAVSADTSAQSVTGATGSLHIGADKTPDTESFFSGLIDDIRIYNRAVEP